MQLEQILVGLYYLIVFIGGMVSGVIGLRCTDTILKLWYEQDIVGWEVGGMPRGYFWRPPLRHGSTWHRNTFTWHIISGGKLPEKLRSDAVAKLARRRLRVAFIMCGISGVLLAIGLPAMLLVSQFFRSIRNIP